MNGLDLAGARQLLAGEIQSCKIFPPYARIVVRNDAALGDAAVVHCDWLLEKKGPTSGDYCREIIPLS